MVAESSSGHPLDNAVWASLTGGHEGKAEVVGSARRYHPDVSEFAAVECFTGGSWADLARLAGPAGRVVLFRDVVPPPPPGWTEQTRGAATQMVLPAGALLDPPSDLAVVPIGRGDLAQVLDLVALAKPGPFRSRTVDMGRFWGSFEDGRLVALAGERLHPDGFTEISAVCTHPDHRRRGLGAAVTHRVATELVEEGLVPFLHVATQNEVAQRVYEGLGFEVRRSVEFVVTGPMVGAARGQAPT